MRLILLPGLDGTGDLFDRFISETPHGYEAQVIAYPSNEPLDYVECVSFIRDKLPKTEPFVLLGESFSGPASILTAAEAPTGLRGLILCNTFAFRPAWEGFKYLPWQLAFRFPIPRYKIGFYLVGRGNIDGWVQPIHDANRKASPKVHAKRMRSVLSVDVRDSLASLTIPILYLRGTRDRLVSGSSLRRIREANGDVLVAKIDAPHLTLQLNPHESWEAITDYCSQHCDK